MGFRGQVKRSTLADANESRDWRIYADFGQRLIVQARDLYIKDDLGLDLSNTVYALDSTTIDLCLSVFPWAHFRTTKASHIFRSITIWATINEALVMTFCSGLSRKSPYPGLLRITTQTRHLRILKCIPPIPQVANACSPQLNQFLKWLDEVPLSCPVMGRLVSIGSGRVHPVSGSQ